MDKKLHKSLLIYVCTIIFIFVSILAFGLNSVVTFAQEARKEQKIVQSIHAYEDISKNERLYQLAEKHVEFKMDSSLEIESVKSIIDFDGNNYVVFEMTPIGYAIYHANSGQFVEYAATSYSPYLGYYDGLYYGGPTQYYIREGTVLRHTLYPDEVILEEEIDECAESCAEMDMALVGEMSEQQMSFINGSCDIDDVSFALEYASATTLSTTPRISMMDFFPKLTTARQIGYRDGNVCGYIASNLIIGYNYFAYDYGLINDLSFVDRTNKTMNGPGLTNKLLELAGEDPTKNDFSGTSAWDAKDYVGKYLNQVNNLKSWTYAWKLFKIDAKSTIDDGFPVALYGNLKKPDNSGKIDHAVVAYSYDSDGHFTVHFGWAGYSKVSTAGGIIGSTFLMYMS